jgi:hypothetical protein
MERVFFLSKLYFSLAAGGAAPPPCVVSLMHSQSFLFLLSLLQPIVVASFISELLLRSHLLVSFSPSPFLSLFSVPFINTVESTRFSILFSSGKIKPLSELK